MSKAITIYGAAGSGSVPVEAALTLLGIPFEVVEAPTWAGPDEQAKVAPVNPMKQIPTLVLPSGEVMTESAAMLIGLADLHPQAKLAPSPTDPGRSQFLRWMVFIPASIYSLFWIRDDPSRMAADKAHETLVVERAAERIADCWAMMDAQVNPGRYIDANDIVLAQDGEFRAHGHDTRRPCSDDERP